MSDGRGWRQRLRYRFDNLLARGTWAVLVWLGVVTLLVVVLSAVLLVVFGVSYDSNEDSSWFEDLWQTLLRVMDPGTMAGDVGWGRRLLALAVTVFGILIAGTLIGVIAAGVEERVDRMRRGRSVVIERDHVVVLGAGDQLPFVIRELVQAPRTDRPAVIVVLADVDPAEVHAGQRGIVDDLAGVRLVVRSGDPTRPADLALVRLDTARSVIVLRHADDAMWSVRSALAVAAVGGGTLPANTVVDVDDANDAARLVESMGAAVHPIVSRDAVARIAAFALRQPGLAAVVEELIDAPRAGIRLGAPGAAGAITFGELVTGLQHVRPIGRLTADGTIDLAPPFDQAMRPDDRLVIVGAGDDLAVVHRPTSSPGADRDVAEPAARPTTVVVDGWSQVGELMLDEWFAGAAPGSSLTIVGDRDGAAAAFVDDHADERVQLVGTVDEAIAVLGDGSDAIVVLLAGAGVGSTVRSSPQDVDADTLLTAARTNRLLAGLARRPRLVVELLDPDSVELAKLDGPDDFVISDALASKFLAQLAIEPLRRDVLLALYGPARPGLEMIDGSLLGLVSRVTMSDIVDRARARGTLAIGWSDGATGELLLAPPLSAAVDWTDHHRVVAVR